MVVAHTLKAEPLLLQQLLICLLTYGVFLSSCDLWRDMPNLTNFELYSVIFVAVVALG